MLQRISTLIIAQKRDNLIFFSLVDVGGNDFLIGTFGSFIKKLLKKYFKEYIWIQTICLDKEIATIISQKVQL